MYDPEKARQLLAEAGHAGGFDAGFYTCDVAYANLGEAAVNYLGEVGIRAKLRPLERAAFFKGYADKKYKNIIQGAMRCIRQCRDAAGGIRGQGRQLCLWQLSRDRRAVPVAGGRTGPDEARGDFGEDAATCSMSSMYVSIWQLAFISGVGPRVGAVRLRPDQGLRLYRALRRNHAEERIRNAAMRSVVSYPRPPSWPGSARPSRHCRHARGKGVDGRAKFGHDDKPGISS